MRLQLDAEHSSTNCKESHSDGQLGGSVTDGQHGGSNTDVQLGGSLTGGKYGGTRSDVQLGGSLTNGQFGGSHTDGQYGGSHSDVQRGGLLTNGQFGGSHTDGQYGGSHSDVQLDGSLTNGQYGESHTNVWFGGPHTDGKYGGSHSDVQLDGSVTNGQYGGSHSGVQLGGSHSSGWPDVTRTDTEKTNHGCVSIPAGSIFQYRYLVVLASSLFMCLQAGVSMTCGLYCLPWIEEFDAASATVSWVASLHVGLTCGASPLSGYLTEKLGYRRTVILGGLVTSAGLISSAFVPNVYLLFLTFGVAAGGGIGISFVAMSTNVTHYFNGRGRVVAVGLVTSGAGVGAFVFPYIITLNITEYGWRGAVLIAGGLSLNMCVFGAILRNPSNFNRDGHLTGTNRLCSPSIRQYGFILYLLHLMLVSAGTSVVFIHIAGSTEKQTSASREESNSAVGMIGLTNLIGRLVWSLIGYSKNVDSMILFLASMTMTGLLSVILPFLKVYTYVIIWSLLFGFFWAPNVSLMQIVALNFVPLSEVNTAFAYVLGVQCVGFMAGAPVAGALYDATSEYGNSFYLGGCFILSGCVALLIPTVNHCKQLLRNRDKVSAPEKTASVIFGSMMFGSQIVHVTVDPETADNPETHQLTVQAEHSPHVSDS